MLNPATAEFVGGLAARLAPGALRAGAGYFEEPRGRWQGQGFVLAPANTDEVAEIVRACAAAGVGVVPYGGGTGLVGGQIMADGPAPVVLSLERMTRVRDLLPSENVLVVEAGAILADVQAAAAGADRLFPLSLASEGSARIGGLLATNAGGVNVLRYGNARAQVLGLEVVTAQGEVWNGLTRLRKDNTGYDLRDLFIGSEGSLGIITAAALRLSPRPAAHGVAMLAVPDPAAALDLLALAGARVGETISAFELIHRQGPDFLSEVGPEVSRPFAEQPDWMVLIDLGLPTGIVPVDVLESLFAEAFAAGIVTDGVVASSDAQAAALWSIRESIPLANRRIGSISSHDVSVPLSLIPEFIDRGGRALAAMGDFRINCFGHLGDGNLHYNVFPLQGRDKAEHLDQREAIKTCVHDLVHELGGSVSAEHGVGRLKVGDLERYADPVKLQLMRRIKDALDPAGIMNPGAVLRAKG
ncbi:FAD-binding oxidoreductase [Loktanella sp. IMCC34160]|uniref:FAD-binding oxidoreductase n=1 Tax=Loktanella sp. IMCC34160 TaxID=2510646 RepID=UPI00101D514A|nr:FAD-binding oxidoreductase [Loktanella sp. IMCC34160]RYG92939.1 FAD-binding oxidoreductase [Loktanella sp. IMCC34160]